MATELLEESIDVNASASDVWVVISDLKRMGEFSPQCVKMAVLGSKVRSGTWTVNLNRRGAIFWPTTAKVVRFTPNEEIGFRITENRTVWSYTIEPIEDGVRLTERREALGGKTSTISSLLIGTVADEPTFESELRLGMAETLAHIKRAVEGSGVRAA